MFSFLGVDYSHTKSNLSNRLEHLDFRIYRIIGHRPISEDELKPSFL